ncbi:hypothetical protein JB92DRAFT_555462 [Gautieria morchelliformis]|nr:hypothetical protein JB92DRAFT_555462 [Gautieria morchelliformis]
MPDNLIYFGIFLIYPKLFSNSFFTLLNARRAFRHGGGHVLSSALEQAPSHEDSAVALEVSPRRFNHSNAVSFFITASHILSHRRCVSEVLLLLPMLSCLLAIGRHPHRLHATSCPAMSGANVLSRSRASLIHVLCHPLLVAFFSSQLPAVPGNFSACRFLLVQVVQ